MSSKYPNPVRFKSRINKIPFCVTSKSIPLENLGHHIITLLIEAIKQVIILYHL